MSERPVVRGRAKADIHQIASYLADEVDDALAERLIIAVRRAIERLSEFPNAGSPILTSRETVNGLRRWRVEGFPDVFVFYLPGPPPAIVRVSHARRLPWWR